MDKTQWVTTKQLAERLSITQHQVRAFKYNRHLKAGTHFIVVGMNAGRQTYRWNPEACIAALGEMAIASITKD